MSTEFFVWYRLDSMEDLDEAFRVIETKANVLMAEFKLLTGMQGRLLKRSDDETHTWMEHYAFEGALDIKKLPTSEIETLFAGLELRLWPDHFPKRHTEQFDLIECLSS
jgi:hypothetical protein